MPKIMHEVIVWRPRLERIVMKVKAESPYQASEIAMERAAQHTKTIGIIQPVGFEFTADVACNQEVFVLTEDEKDVIWPVPNKPTGWTDAEWSDYQRRLS